MRIDLHVHTSERSDCGTSTEAEMIEAAKAAGLDAIVLTDHGRLAPHDHLAEINALHAPFRIFPGIEVSLPAEDVVVVGLDDPRLENVDWTYEELHPFVEREGGFLFLAHPFRFHESVDIDVERFPPGAVEVNSSNMGKVDVALLEDWLRRHDLQRIVTSDAHTAPLVGVYHLVLDCRADDVRRLVSILKSGRFQPARMDERITAWNAVGRQPLR